MERYKKMCIFVYDKNINNGDALANELLDKLNTTYVVGKGNEFPMEIIRGGLEDYNEISKEYLICTVVCNRKYKSIFNRHPVLYTKKGKKVWTNNTTLFDLDTINPQKRTPVGSLTNIVAIPITGSDCLLLFMYKALRYKYKGKSIFRVGKKSYEIKDVYYSCGYLNLHLNNQLKDSHYSDEYLKPNCNAVTITGFKFQESNKNTYKNLLVICKTGIVYKTMYIYVLKTGKTNQDIANSIRGYTLLRTLNRIYGDVVVSCVSVDIIYGTLEEFKEVYKNKQIIAISCDKKHKNNFYGKCGIVYEKKGIIKWCYKDTYVDINKIKPLPPVTDSKLAITFDIVPSDYINLLPIVLGLEVKELTLCKKNGALSEFTIKDIRIYNNKAYVYVDKDFDGKPEHNTYDVITQNHSSFNHDIGTFNRVYLRNITK